MSERANRRTRAEMITGTREALIRSARQLFADRGYAATSMDDLCAEAGLTRGALYHHFGGKEGLLEAVVVQIDAEISDRLDAEFRAGPVPWAAFRTCCSAYLSMALDPEVQRICLRDAPAVLGQRLRDLDAAASVAPMVNALRILMDEGAVRRADPEALARMLNGAMVDAALWIAASDDPAAALAGAQSALGAILDGLTAGRD